MDSSAMRSPPKNRLAAADAKLVQDAFVNTVWTSHRPQPWKPQTTLLPEIILLLLKP